MRYVGRPRPIEGAHSQACNRQSADDETLVWPLAPSYIVQCDLVFYALVCFRVLACDLCLRSCGRDLCFLYSLTVW